jgi:Zn-dependent protease with chaperone function
MSHSSLTARAALAVALFVGFYVLALGIAALLVYLPYLEYSAAHTVHLKILLFCLIGAGMIVWSIFPRFDKFEAPGPVIDLSKNPAFHAAIKDIAARSKQTMPEQIYLVSELNAWVSSRGGFMGFGSKRVMGIGLPLIGELTVDQLQSVLAHEFGHYYGGDVKLGPWIYKTRSAIGRTINNLAHHSGLLQKPFLWYGNAFLRITHKISRQQEFAADALAAQLFGKKAMIDGLTRIHKIAPAFDWFWRSEMGPVLEKGYYAPISNGFTQYLQSSDVVKNMEEALKEQLTAENADPFDTHPTLRERLGALGEYSEKTGKGDERPASMLFGQKIDELETLFVNWAASTGSTKLTVIGWNEVASTIFPRIWEEGAKECKDKFTAGTTVLDFPLLMEDTKLFPMPKAASVPEGMTESQVRTYLMNSELSALLGHALVQDGWEPRTSPGTSVVLFKNDKSFAAFDLTRKLLHEEMSKDAWHEACKLAGVEKLAIA